MEKRGQYFCLSVVLLVLNSAKYLQAAQPHLFQDYFHEDVKVVSLSLIEVIEKCVKQPTQLINKMKISVKGCLGTDSVYNYDDFAKLNQGQDSDKNGLTVNLENGEACFYGEMGWVVGAKVNKTAVIQDFSNLVSESAKKSFMENINRCSAWNGEFVKSNNRRRKRGIFYSDYGEEGVDFDYYSNEDEEEREYTDDRNKEEGGYPDNEDEDKGEYPDVVPDSDEDRGGMLSWLINLGSHRVRRQAPSKKKSGMKQGKGGSNGGLGVKKLPKKAGMKQRKSGINVGPGVKKFSKKGIMKQPKNGNNVGLGGKKIPKKEVKNGKKKTVRGKNPKYKKKGSNRKRGGMGKKKKKSKKKKKKFGKKKKQVSSKQNQPMGPTRTLKEQVYNQLWCFDLSVEQALRECVKEKLN